MAQHSKEDLTFTRVLLNITSVHHPRSRQAALPVQQTPEVTQTIALGMSLLCGL